MAYGCGFALSRAREYQLQYHCGVRHDHLFVPMAAARRVMALLESLQREAQDGPAHTTHTKMQQCLAFFQIKLGSRARFRADRSAGGKKTSPKGAKAQKIRSSTLLNVLSLRFGGFA